MKTFITNIYRGIFFETTDKGEKKFSIGRLMLAALFIQAMFTWNTLVDIPQTQVNTLMALLVYVLGTKGMSVVKDIITKKKEDNA